MAGRTKPSKPAPRSGRDSLGQAQDLIYQAWEIASLKRRIALARKAIAISPDCADAYVLLAEAATTPDKTLELYRKGLQAGERALGKNAFKDEVGSFWGILETRPYMRARAGVAQSLWECGQPDEALAHWRDMLRLNPNDNQGIRYVLSPPACSNSSATASSMPCSKSTKMTATPICSGPERCSASAPKATTLNPAGRWPKLSQAICTFLPICSAKSRCLVSCPITAAWVMRAKQWLWPLRISKPGRRPAAPSIGSPKESTAKSPPSHIDQLTR